MSQETIGTRIRQARHQASMTQAALAHAAGTRERNIIRWENDQNAPRFEHVAAIAKATGKDVSFFLGDDEDEEAARPMAQMSILEALYEQLTIALGKERV